MPRLLKNSCFRLVHLTLFFMSSHMSRSTPETINIVNREYITIPNIRQRNGFFQLTNLRQNKSFFSRRNVVSRINC